MRHDSFICETWLIHMWDMTHSYVRHVSFIWDVTHSSVMCTVGLGLRQGVPRFSRRGMSHIWMSHAMLMNESCRTYEWVMVHIWMRQVVHINEMSHDAHMNESRHTYKWVVLLIWMSHVASMNESWCNCECVMLHISIKHGAHLNESRHTCKSLILCTRRRHVAHMNEARGTYKWVMSHIWIRHAAHMWTSHVTHEACYSYEWGSIHQFINS